MEKGRKEAAELEKSVPAPEQKEVTMERLPGFGTTHMTAAELEQWLSQFQSVIKDAKIRYDAAVADEQAPNSSIQDILHAAELAPSTLDPERTLEQLTKFRRARRDLKKELEVTEIFKEWVDKHQAAFNQLSQTIGAIRKVLNRQPNDAYRFKTDAVGNQGDFLQPDPVAPQPVEDTYEN